MFRILISRPEQGHPQSQHILGIETKVEMAKSQEGFGHQSGSSKQNQREGELACNEETTQAMSPRALSGASPALFEGFIRVRLRASAGRSQAKQKTRANGDHEGVEEDPSIDS